MMNWRKPVLLAMLGLFAGCSGYEGPPLMKVTGVVNLDGQPLAGATVMFEPLDGSRGSLGKTDEQGKFNMSFVGQSGMPAGDYKIKISTIEEKTNETGEVVGLSPETLPEIYNKQTTLRKKVTYEGEREFVFDLKSSQ